MRFSRILMGLALIAGLLMVQNVAFAGGGGGGAKSNPTIVAKNNTAYNAWVIIDPTPATEAAFFANTLTEAQFRAAGGVILSPGRSHTFRVLAGQRRVVAGLESGGIPVGGLADETYVVEAKQKLNVYVNYDANTNSVFLTP